MALLTLLAGYVLIYAQDVPQGVRYKAASDTLNQLAVTKLQKFFGAKNGHVPNNFASQVVLCGPSMWHGMASSAPKSLVDAQKGTYVIPTGSTTVQVEGRMFKTPAQQLAFWKMILDATNNRKPTIRKANAEELKFYWSWIAWDITEPLYIADFGKARLLFNFIDEKGDPRVFIVDAIPSLVGKAGSSQEDLATQP